VFDGGNGEVTGIGGGTLPPPSSPPPSSPGPSNPPPGAGSTEYAVVNSWGNGFQGKVTVRASASGAVNNWMVHWSWPANQTLTQAWNGRATSDGSFVTIDHETWNSSIPAGGTVEVGFLANGAAPATLPGLMCMLG